MKKLLILLVLNSCLAVFSQKNLDLKGMVVDNNQQPIQYASVSVPKLYLVTSTTEEGKFSLSLADINFDLKDIIEISSFGHPTRKLTIQDYLDLNDKAIVIGGDIPQKNKVNTIKKINRSKVAKTEVVKHHIETSEKSAKDYVEMAYASIVKNTINTPHELSMLYRRFSVENNKARFLVEHCMSVLDKGPLNGNYKGSKIQSGRKSQDHRLIKKKMIGHPVNQVAKKDPLREGVNFDDYDWRFKGNSSYDGEDIVIVEGWQKDSNSKYIRYYIGTKTFGVYKIEKAHLNSVFIYRKDENGKLHLSYHNRTRTSKAELSPEQKRILKTNKYYVTESYKHEVFVLGVKKLIPKKYDRSIYKFHKEDIGDIDITYTPSFWRKLNLPPSTAFYKESVKELEKISGASIQKQFRRVN
ncbi:hypothetical protein [Algibacter sp. 2305UL17-15]|uniref:hypothetical protein n=1 Tax=Algibacter sp. 2305UL17-15 TaxID=3231268 RepID=UPI003458904C